MRIIITILCVFIMSWLYMGAPTGPKAMFGQIKPLKRSSELPTFKLPEMTAEETMASIKRTEEYIKKRDAERQKNKTLNGNKVWTQIHRDLVSTFEDLKKSPCNEEYIKAYAAMVSEFFVYSRANKDKGTLKPVDPDLAEQAERAIWDSISGKYIIRGDLTWSALSVFSLPNTERAACKD